MDKFAQLFQQIETEFHIKLSPNQRHSIRATIETPGIAKTLTEPAQKRFFEQLPINREFDSTAALRIAGECGVSRPTAFRLLSKLERTGHGLYRITT